MTSGEVTMEGLVDDTTGTETDRTNPLVEVPDATQLLTEAVVTNHRTVQGKQVVLVSENIVYPKQGVKVKKGTRKEGEFDEDDDDSSFKSIGKSDSSEDSVAVPD